MARCQWLLHRCVELDPTLIGFRRSTKNASALCVRNLVNLWTRMFSISSACLMRMLTRVLLTLGSTSTRSLSLRATTSGFNASSGAVPASTSGTLCRSAVCEAKLERARAAVSVARTQAR